jgi:pyruvate,water dikinase
VIGWFADVGLGDRAAVGGKGGSLGELTRAGITVPPGFVIKTPAFLRFIERLEREAPVRERVQSLNAEDIAAVAALSSELRARISAAPLPPEVAGEIAEAHAALCVGPQCAVAVRSSATTEDAADASFAGLQDTYLWVRNVEQCQELVRSCWGSLYSVESITYRRRRGFEEGDVAMAVVVQTMVDARTAGVMFTRSPLTGDRSVMTIEGSWGLGSAVVGGEVTPDRWVVGKITGEISVREISTKRIRHAPAASGGIETQPVPEELQCAPCMSDDELQTLRDIGRSVERHYGRAQDIEWAVERDSREILLLQSRPETVWSAREAEPVGRAAANPSLHVLSIFGRR